jgi:hypothetical protein
MMANDPLYLGFNHEFGPDGGLYVIDWYDPKTCHGQTAAHIETGRIYKITYGESKKVDVDLAKLPSAELVKLIGSTNEWYVRHARRLLQERGADPAVHEALKKQVADASDRLRWLWTLHGRGERPKPSCSISSRAPRSMSAPGRSSCCSRTRKPRRRCLKELARLAKDDESTAVRLYVAAAAQRIAPAERWEIVEGLATHAEDATDHNLPTMIWYAAEPLVLLDSARALKLATGSKIPRLRELITRRMVAGASGNAPRRRRRRRSSPPSRSDTALVLAVKPKESRRESRSRSPGAAACVRRPRDHLVFRTRRSCPSSRRDSFTISAWVHLKEVPQDGWKGVVTKSRDAKPWYGLWIDGEGRWVFGGPRT